MTPEEQVKEAIALGDQQESYGNFAESHEKFAAAVALCWQHNLPAALAAIALTRVAVNAVNRDDNETADSNFQAAITAFEADETRSNLEYADCLTHYGHFLRGAKQWSPAVDQYAKAYILYREITSLPAADVQQRRLALRNSLKSTAEQSDDAVRDQLRERVHAMLPRKDSPLFP